MRFIKRLIFILILLLISFFIYRLISPKSANQLLHDLKTVANDTIGTHFVLTGDDIVDTGISLDITDAVLENTGGLQEITGDDILLLNDVQFSGESFTTGITETGLNASTSTSTPTPIPTPTPAPQKKTPPKTASSQKNSEADILQNLLKNFSN